MRWLLALVVLAVPASAQGAHRLFLAPTARPIPAGTVSLGVTNVFVPTAAVGVGSGVSVGAGVVAVPASELAGIVFVEPKLTVWDRPGLALALGVTARANPFQNGAVHAVPYAVATAERGRWAGTAGVGRRVNYERRASPCQFLRDPRINCGSVGEQGRSLSVVAAPAAFGGLEVRTSERWTWVVEATAVPDQVVGYEFGTGEGRLERKPVHYDLTLGAGFRVTTGRAAVDAGLIVGQDANGSTAPAPLVAPWLSVGVGLGR
ncbi:hypothetical protein [Rubrivirga sp.]|uniref:hypothetical protein n=1 Tax=Rubrivirga sp. TaxID=1885344 RepID=UPI003B52A385